LDLKNIFLQTSKPFLKKLRIYVRQAPATVPIKSMNQLNIYSNAESTVLTLEDIAVNSHIVIYDITGKALQHYSSTGGKQCVDISSLPEGLYFINILKDGEVLGGAKFLVSAG